MKLENKTAVITGGNSGIGFAIAKQFEKEGARVVIFGRNTESLAAALKELGDNAHAVQGDVTKQADLNRLFTETENKFGKIDVLVANAGVAGWKPLGDVTEAEFDKLSDINFKGAYFTIQSALPNLATKASVVITGSAVSYNAMPGMAAYAATKAAVRSLGRSFAAEFAPRGVRVNVLSPGVIPTPIYGTLGMSDDAASGMVQEFTAQIPLNRAGNPAEMAKAAVFLASEDSSYMTGADLVADGGFSA